MEEYQDETSPLTVTTSSGGSTPLSASKSPLPMETKSPSSFGGFFIGCCGSAFASRESSDFTRYVDKTTGHAKSTTGELIRQLTQAEVDGQNMIHRARLNRLQLIERAKQEAEYEARIYAEQFRIEFGKLETKHQEEIERYNYEAHHIEKEIARASKKGYKQKQAMLYILDRTCAIDLSLPDVMVQHLRRCYRSTKPEQIEQSLLDETPSLSIQQLQYGYCSKHRTPESKTKDPIGSSPPDLVGTVLPSAFNRTMDRIANSKNAVKRHSTITLIMI